RNAVFALRMAEVGVKGPYEPFTGTMGVNYQLMNRNLSIENIIKKFNDCTSPKSILKTYIKNWQVEYMTQSAIEATLEARKKFSSMNDVKHIRIETFQMAYDILAKDIEKWHPKTRETADHSLPFIV